MPRSKILTFTALIALILISATSAWNLRDQVRNPLKKQWYNVPFDDDLAPTCAPESIRADMTAACLSAQLKAVEAYVASMANPATDDDSRVVFGRDLITQWQESAEDMCVLMANDLPVWEESFWTEQFEFLLEEMNKPPKPENPEGPVTIIKKSVITTKTTSFSLKICGSTGDPHITAFDKSVNHFTEAGKGLNLFRYRDFALIADTHGRGLTSTVTLLTEGHKLVFNAGKTVLFDGRTIRVGKIPTPLPSGITVKLVGTKYVVASPAGATVEIAKIGVNYFNVYVSVPQDWIGGAFGRCIHKDHTFHVVNKETCVQKCDDDLKLHADEDTHHQCTALCDDDVRQNEAVVDKLMALPWKSDKLRERAEHVCGKVLKLDQPYRNFCLEDVKLTNDIDAAQNFVDVKSSLKVLKDIDNKEEHGTRAKIFGLLAQQLDALKNTQEEISRLMGKLDVGKLKGRVEKFLSENNKDIEELRNVQQEITTEILDEEQDPAQE